MHFLLQRELPTEGLPEVQALARKVAAELGVDLEEAFAQFRAKEALPCEPGWKELHGLWIAWTRLLVSRAQDATKEGDDRSLLLLCA